MKNRQPPTLLLVIEMLVILVARTQAQAVLPETPASPQPTGQTHERQYGRVSIQVTRSLRVALGNRTTGRIVVKGWDRDTLEAHAISQRGDEVVIIGNSDESLGTRVFLKADYADLDQPAAPTNRLDEPPMMEGRPVKVDLEVSLPRHAEIELIRVISSEVEVFGMEMPIAVSGRKSNVTLKRVKSASVHTRSGNVEIDDANGLVEVATTSGSIRVHNTKGAVRVASISGPIEIKCASGRIEVANTEAPIDLVNIDGDVDAIATNGSLRFIGSLSEDGRYHLKSMSGRVEMTLPSNTHGFSAVLSSYRGVVETDFALNSKQGITSNSLNPRVTGRFGNGRAQIALDSFEGLVRLTKTAPGAIESCKP